jgi:transcriptional regulator with XRE-family HTH domain
MSDMNFSTVANPLTESNLVGRHQGDPAWELAAVEEGFIVDVQGLLQELMDERGMSRAGLARAMGVSRARVTQLFSDKCTNMTVRVFAQAVHALGDVPMIDGERLRRTREERARVRRARSISASDNVHPLWRDSSPAEPPAVQACNGDDERLDGIVRAARRAGARR